MNNRKSFENILWVCFISFLFQFCGTLVCAQKEVSSWHIGEGYVVDFSSDIPNVNTKTEINTVHKRASFTISDKDGNLLFYTDGISIWDGSHTIIENGLFGDTYVTVIPHPNQPNLYYLAYIGWLENPESYPKDSLITQNRDTYDKIIKKESEIAKRKPVSKLYYTLLDIKNKKCIEKNVLLSTNVLFMVCVARHANEKDYWLISHKENSNEFQIYAINDKGLQKNTTKISIGKNKVHQKGGMGADANFIKSNMQGNSIVFNQVNRTNLTFELFTFNNTQGIFKEVKEISLKANIDSVSLIGQEFSPNGKYLFTVFSEDNSPNYFTAGYIKQFDIQAGKEIKAVRFMTKNRFHASQRMQLALDGNIYIETSNGRLVDKPYLRIGPEPIICLKGINKVLNYKESLKIIDFKVLFWAGRMPDVNHLLPLSLADDDENLKIGKSFNRNFFFDTNQSILKPEYETELQDIVDFLKQNPASTVEILGHTDNEGEAGKNLKLSQDRAQSLANFLIKNKVEASRIKAIGYGSTKPIADNDTPEGRAKNRRIEFLISEKK